MKTLHTADWHIGCDPHHDADLKRAVIEMSKAMPRRVVIAGDLFHRNNPSADEERFAFELLAYFCNFSEGPERWDAVIHVIAGNHDHEITDALFNDFVKVSFWSEYLAYPREDGQCGNLVLAPHGKIGELVGGYDDGSVLVMHGYPPGYRPQYMKDDDSDYDVLDDVPAGVSAIVAGHCHCMQDLTWCYSRRIIIPGAPTPVTFGEEGQRKGWFVHDVDFEFVEFAARKTTTIDLSRQSGLVRDDVVRLFPGSGAARLILPASCRPFKRAFEMDFLKAGHDTAKILFAKPERESVTVRSRGGDHVRGWVEGNVPAEFREPVLDEIGSPPQEPSSSAADRTPISFVQISNYRAALRLVAFNVPESGCLGIVGEAAGDGRRSNGQGKSSVLQAIASAYCGGLRKDDIGLHQSSVSVHLQPVGSAFYKSSGKKAEYVHLGECVWKTFYEYVLIGVRSLLDARPAERLELLLEDVPIRTWLKRLQEKKKLELRGLRESELADLGREAQLAGDLRLAETGTGLTVEGLKHAVVEMRSRGLRLQDDIAKIGSGIDAREDLNRLDEIRAACPDLDQLEEKLRKTRELLLEKKEEIASSSSVLEKLKADLVGVRERINLAGSGKCPITDKVICPLQDKTTGRNIIAKLEDERDDLRHAIKAMGSALKMSGQDVVEQLESRLAELEDQDEKRRTYQSLVDKKEELEKIAVDDLEEARDDLADALDFARINNEEHDKTLRLLGKQEQIEEQRVQDESELADLRRRIAERETRIKVLEHVVACTADTGAINLALREHADRINEISAQIAGDFGFWQEPRLELRFAADKPVLTVDFTGPGCVRGRRPYSDCSRGEKAICNLIFQLARREISEERDGIFPLLMVDELLDSLDAENYDLAVDWLQRCGYQVLLVSHNPRLRELVKCFVVGGE